MDHDPLAGEVPPCLHSFPIESWPLSIRPPSEGALDREQFRQVVHHLRAFTGTAGDEAMICFATYRGEHDEAVYEGTLDELLLFYDADHAPEGPTNVWPADRSWFVYSDWDLWATKVSGPRALIDRITDDPALETVDLRW